ncbi:hypothetical protein HZS_7857 [Henneguya salminicola]|nr:hypothetical protein HZS_7857 [Henneguya salminicola]
MLKSSSDLIINQDGEIDQSAQNLHSNTISKNMVDSDIFEVLNSASKCLTLAEKYIHSSTLNSSALREQESDDQINKVKLQNNTIELHALTNELFNYGANLHGIVSINNNSTNNKLPANFEKTNLLNEVNQLKAESESFYKHKENLEKAIEQLLTVNKSLESQNSTILSKYQTLQEQLVKINDQVETKTSELFATSQKNKTLDNELTVKQSEIDRVTLEYNKIKLQLDQYKLKSDSQSDLTRLKSHLVEVEDGYTRQIKGLEESKKSLEIMLQNLSLDLNRTKVNLQEARSNYERHLKVLNEQLGRVTTEKDQLVSQIVNLSKLTNSQEKTINSLHNSLNDTQKELESQQNLLMESHSYALKELQDKSAFDLSKQSAELQEKLRFDYDVKINELNQLLLNSQSRVEELSKENSLFISSDDKNESFIPSISSDDKNIEKFLLKNLIHAYIRLGDEHKPFVWRVICSVVGVEPEDIRHDNTSRNPLSWIPVVNRLFSSTSPSKNTEPSLSELFMQYLEEESKKISATDPYVPPISTEELKNFASKHVGNNLSYII